MLSLHNQTVEHHEVTSNTKVSFSADSGRKSSPAKFCDSYTVRSSSKIPGRYMKMCHDYFFSYYYGLVFHNKNYFYHSALNEYAEEETMSRKPRRTHLD